ncbi:hypothetical protein QBC44DRAFT_402400 [Cladorrhinum sp. PSN332]|nr:hypothetical protein QBC44DRAFT_402400 [Cladorrhinum sp. PSN332]
MSNLYVGIADDYPIPTRGPSPRSPHTTDNIAPHLMGNPGMSGGLPRLQLPTGRARARSDEPTGGHNVLADVARSRLRRPTRTRTISGRWPRKRQKNTALSGSGKRPTLQPQVSAHASLHLQVLSSSAAPDFDPSSTSIAVHSGWRSDSPQPRLVGVSRSSIVRAEYREPSLSSGKVVKELGLLSGIDCHTVSFGPSSITIETLITRGAEVPLPAVKQESQRTNRGERRRGGAIYSSSEREIDVDDCRLWWPPAADRATNSATIQSDCFDAVSAEIESVLLTYHQMYR